MTTYLKRSGIVLLFYCMISVAHAQVLLDKSINSEFEAQVKSLDEFRMRFNGKESKPGIKEDENSRRDNIISLFNFSMDKGGQTQEQLRKQMNAFVDSVLVNNVEFQISDAGLWAECLCRMKYKGEGVSLTLIMHSESYKKDMFRWAISGVQGLNKVGIIERNIYPISPVEHEIHFMGLQDMFNENSTHAFGYRSKDAKIDDLSVFLTLIYTGQLKFDIVERQIFYYADIPGYIITIEEIVRRGHNSGWLITSFKEMSSKEKQKYINKLHGYE